VPKMWKLKGRPIDLCLSSSDLKEKLGRGSKNRQPNCQKQPFGEYFALFQPVELASATGWGRAHGEAIGRECKVSDDVKEAE